MVAAYLLTETRVSNVIVALVAGLVVAAAVGFLVGLVALRRTGIYFAMITVAIAEVLSFVEFSPLSDFTGGENGLPGVPPPSLDLGFRTVTLDVASYCPQVHEVRSKSSLCRAIALMRSPFCFPRITWTASSSPRLTRCNTVWRETPSAFIASRIGMKPSLASLLN